MSFWGKEIRRETQRYERETNREYKTERGLWLYQDNGSREIDNVRESDIYEAIAEYERSNDWN